MGSDEFLGCDRDYDFHSLRWRLQSRTSNRQQPREKMSAFSSYGWLSTTSGAMFRNDPVCPALMSPSQARVIVSIRTRLLSCGGQTRQCCGQALHSGGNDPASEALMV